MVGSISRLVNDLIFVNELITKHGGSWSEHGGMQSEGSFHIILKKLVHFRWIFCYANYLVGGYVKYIWHVKRIIFLSHDLTMFSYIFNIIPHNFKLVLKHYIYIFDAKIKINI